MNKKDKQGKGKMPSSKRGLVVEITTRPPTKKEASLAKKLMKKCPKGKRVKKDK